jgi:deoxyribodipyrimidine photo-lyase
VSQGDAVAAGEVFPPTDAALEARLDAIRPDAYARTRNHLEGAVTRLSPYLTHGFITTVGVRRALAERGHALRDDHKLVFELGWREYFRHVWRHDGEGILASLHEGPRPDADYARELPADLRAARTGVPAIDSAVAQLYTTGWLHNHARMWLASYTVHLRGVHWRAGADWMLAHLLDGDLASNHLSWQWVAGTGSSKPYLFNAENVARWAGAAWHSPGTPIDASYEALDAIARGHRPVRAFDRRAPIAAADEPAVFARPPDGRDRPVPTPAAFAGRTVRLAHPWALARPADLEPGEAVVGAWVWEPHDRWPWAARRWDFVARRMDELAPEQYAGTAAQWREALAAARRARALDDPHLEGAWAGAVERQVPEALFDDPARACRSFSQWWNRVTRKATC